MDLTLLAVREFVVMFKVDPFMFKVDPCVAWGWSTHPTFNDGNLYFMGI